MKKTYQPLTLEEFSSKKTPPTTKEAAFIVSSATGEPTETTINSAENDFTPNDMSHIPSQTSSDIEDNTIPDEDTTNIPPKEEDQPLINEEPLLPEVEETPPEPEIPPAPTFSEEELAMAKAIAYQEGYDKAIEESRHNHLAHLHESLDHLVEAINNHIRQKNLHLETITLKAADVILELYKQSLPFFVKKYGITEIIEAVKELIPTLIDEDQLTFKFSSIYQEILDKKIPEILQEHHFKGETHITYDTLPDLYVQIKWRLGQITQDPTRLNEEITKVVEDLKKYHNQEHTTPIMQEEGVVIWENIKKPQISDDIAINQDPTSPMQQTIEASNIDLSETPITIEEDHSSTITQEEDTPLHT